MPRWLRVIRFALFPVDSLYWMLSESRGYQFERDVWKIEGVTWSGRALRQLAQAQGHEFKVCRIDDVVYLVRLK